MIIEFTPSTALFHPPSPFLEQFQQVSFFHLHTCIYTVSTIFILLLPPTSHQCQFAPQQNQVCTLVLWFCTRKNIKDSKRNVAFLLLWDKDSYTGRFLMFHAYMCYNPNWFISMNHLHYFVVPFLKLA
jgi:hypothetical protein